MPIPPIRHFGGQRFERFTPIQILRILNSGFLRVWVIVWQNVFIDIDYIHNLEHFEREKNFY